MNETTEPSPRVPKCRGCNGKGFYWTSDVNGNVSTRWCPACNPEPSPPPEELGLEISASGKHPVWLAVAVHLALVVVFVLLCLGYTSPSQWNVADWIACMLVAAAFIRLGKLEAERGKP